jgi:hypothetical protein
MLIFIVKSFAEEPTTKLEKSYAMHDTYIDKDFQKLDHSLLAKKGETSPPMTNEKQLQFSRLSSLWEMPAGTMPRALSLQISNRNQ